MKLHTLVVSPLIGLSLVLGSAATGQAPQASLVSFSAAPASSLSIESEAGVLKLSIRAGRAASKVGKLSKARLPNK